jgi:hypothetical protein
LKAKLKREKFGILRCRLKRKNEEKSKTNKDFSQLKIDLLKTTKLNNAKMSNDFSEEKKHN